MTASIGNVPGQIFMSYRREDTAYPAGWLYDRLADHFGKTQVFKDIDSIELGDDFVEVITAAVGSCDVLLALIGDQWLTVTGQDGRRRLDNPGDFVRLEIEAALTRNVRVIPILVAGARMPREDEMPASLAKLAHRQALELSPSRFDADTGRLMRVLDRTISKAQEQARQRAEDEARHRQQVEQLQRQIRERAAAQDWDAVVAADGELAALDPAVADPDGLASMARERITRRQRAEERARHEVIDGPPESSSQIGEAASSTPLPEPDTDKAVPETPAGVLSVAPTGSDPHVGVDPGAGTSGSGELPAPVVTPVLPTGKDGHVLWALTPVLTLGLLLPVPIAYAARRLRSPTLWVVTFAYAILWVTLLIVIIVQSNLGHLKAALFASGWLLFFSVVAAVHALRLRYRVFVAPNGSLPDSGPNYVSPKTTARPYGLRITPNGQLRRPSVLRQLPLIGRRVKLYARRIENAREVHSDCRAELCPRSRAAPGRGPCLAVLFCRAQAAGLDHRPVGRQVCRSARRVRQCGLCPAFRPVSSWVPAALRTRRSRQCDGRRVKLLQPFGVMAMPVPWDTTVEQAADLSLQLQP